MEPNEDQLASEREEIIRWHVATHAPSYIETVERWAQGQKEEALKVMTDMTKPEAERNKAAGKYELANNLVMKRSLADNGYEELKKYDSEREAAQKEEPVGSKAEDQWYDQ